MILLLKNLLKSFIKDYKIYDHIDLFNFDEKEYFMYNSTIYLSKYKNGVILKRRI